MEVSGQLHAPATLPPEREHPILIRYEAGWARWRGEKFLDGGILCELGEI
jgi:hypothetical protein